MSKSGSAAEMRPLVMIHVLVMFALAAGWGYYCWTHIRLPRRGSGPAGLDGALQRAMDGVTAAAGDVTVGLCTLVLFAVGTGIYVRRLQVWLDARSAGEAVAYGSADLKDQALAANAKNRGGA